jgi:hypothetical protein
MPGRLTVNIDFPKLAPPIELYRPNGPFMGLTQRNVYETFQSGAFEKNRVLSFGNKTVKQQDNHRIPEAHRHFQSELLSRENCIQGLVSHTKRWPNAVLKPNLTGPRRY